MPLPSARRAEVFDRVSKPLPTSFNSGVSIEVVRRRLGHASTETTRVYVNSPTKSPTPRSVPRASGARPLAGDLGSLKSV